MKINAGSFVPGIGVAEGLAGAVNKHAEKGLKNAEAKHALAEGDPNAYVLAEKQKTKRLAMIVGGLVLVSAGMTGGAIYGINRATGALDNFANHFKPKTISLLQAQSYIDEIKISDKTPLVDAHAQGSAQFHTENYVLGMYQPGGDSDTYSDRSMGIETGVDAPTGEALRFAAVRVGSGTYDFGMAAIVNTDKFYVETVNPQPESAPMSGDGVVRGIVGALQNDANVGGRQTALDDYLDKDVTSSCAADLNDALVPAIDSKVFDFTQAELAILKQVDPNSDAVKVLENTLKYKPAIIWTGQYNSAASINLSSFARPVPTLNEMAQVVGSDPDHTTINGLPDCMQTQAVVTTKLEMAQSDTRPVVVLPPGYTPPAQPNINNQTKPRDGETGN